MVKNFIIGQSNELCMSDRVYDLHNCYDFDQLTILEGEIMKIVFVSNNICDNEDIVVITVYDMDYFEISHNFSQSNIRDLEEIGYKVRDDRDDTWLLTENQATESADIFFRFADSHFIRVHGRKMLLTNTSDH